MEEARNLLPQPAVWLVQSHLSNSKIHDLNRRNLPTVGTLFGPVSLLLRYL